MLAEVRLYKKEIVLTGWRDTATGLYLIGLNEMIGKVTPTGIQLESVAQTLDFWIAAMGSPPTSSILRAIHLGLDIPGLTEKALRKYNRSYDLFS